ncbi:MAG: ABC transporter permease [Bdellovibrio sp.]|nr:MAG: ABC transporter permease [Bdellovibrio sp.]
MNLMNAAWGQRWREVPLRSLINSLWGLLLGLILSLGLCVWAGENPWHIFRLLVTSSFGSIDDFALSAFYASSLMFTGLAVALSFRAGLFNIGAEGQLLAGSIASTVVALATSVGAAPEVTPWSLAAFLLSFATAALAGGFWGLVPALLKAYRGGHEVIVTMMMNFIAAGIVSYVVVGPFHSHISQSPETTSVPAVFQFSSWDPIHHLAPQSPLNISILVAIGLCLLCEWMFRKTQMGFEWRAIGLNPSAAEWNAISRTRYILVPMTASGAVAGLVALNEIFGSAGNFRLGFSADYGFVGIAVALLARNNPIAIIPSALLFGALQKGAADLDLETQLIGRDFARVIQAVVVLSVIACSALPRLKVRWSHAGN